MIGGAFEGGRDLQEPATIRDYVQQDAAESGANYFVGAFQWGDLTHEESANSMRLFAQEVMPAVAARQPPG